MLTSVWKLLSQLWALLAVTGLGARGRAAAAASVLAVQAGEWVGCAVWGSLPLGNAAPDSQVPRCDSRGQGAGLFPTAGPHLLPRLVAVLLKPIHEVLSACSKVVCSQQISLWWWITDRRKCFCCVHARGVPRPASEGSWLLPRTRLGVDELRAQDVGEGCF